MFTGVDYQKYGGKTKILVARHFSNIGGICPGCPPTVYAYAHTLRLR